MYLNEFLSKSKRSINGSQFAQLLKVIGDAKFNGVYSYTEETITSLEKEFFQYQSTNSIFTVSDLLDILQAFDRVSSVQTVPEVMKSVVNVLPQSIKNSDEDMLALFGVFNRVGLLKHEKYEHLLHFVQDYAASRYEFMDKLIALKFAQFLLKIGLWQWDQTLMSQIEAHFSKNYIEYDVKAMCLLLNLVGQNFQKSEPTLQLINDSIRLRLNHVIKNDLQTSEMITVETVRNVVEGLSANSSAIGT